MNRHTSPAVLRIAASFRQRWPYLFLLILPFVLDLGRVRRAEIVHDEAWIAAHARHLLRGAIPHADFFDLQLSGTYVPLVLLFRFTGPSIVAARMLALLVLGVIAALGLRVTRARVPLVPALAVWSAFLAWTDTAAFYSMHWMFTLAAMLLTFVTIRALERGGLPSARATGLLLGTAATFVHPRAAVLALAVTGFLVAAHRVRGSLAGERGGSVSVLLARVAIWAVAPVAALTFVLALFQPRHLTGLIDDTIVFPLREYAKSASLPFGASLTNLRFSGLEPAAQSAVRILVTFLPPLLVLVAAASWWLARRRREHVPDPTRALLVSVAAAGWVSSMNRPDALHFLFGLPLALPLLLDLLGRGIAVGARHARVAAGATAAVALALAAPITVARIQAGVELDTPVETRVGQLRARKDDGAVAVTGLLMKLVPAGEAVVAVPYLCALPFMLDARNPTRYEFIMPGYQGRRHVEAVAGPIESGLARFVFLDEAQFGEDFYRDYFPRIDRAEAASGRRRFLDAIARCCREVGRIGSIRVFERR